MSRKVSVVATFGAVKLAIDVFAFDRVTVGVPATCAQANPVAFSDAEPSSCTSWPCCTVRVAGACAITGSAGKAAPVTITGAVPEPDLDEVTVTMPGGSWSAPRVNVAAPAASAPKPCAVSVGGVAVSLEVALTTSVPVSELYAALVTRTWSVKVTFTVVGGRSEVLVTWTDAGGLRR